MSDKPETVYITKSVLADGKVERVLAYQIPTTTSWIGASGRWRHIHIDGYYVHRTEEEAVKLAKSRIKYQIESNLARNEKLASFDCAVIDATDEPVQLKHAAE